VQIGRGNGTVCLCGDTLNHVRTGVLITALDTADGRLGDFQRVRKLPLGQPALFSPPPEVHGPNIRNTHNASSAFYVYGGLPSKGLPAQDYFMAKKRKRRPTFIKEWRKHRGLTQDQLASRLEMAQPTVARIERGEISYTQPVLEAMADALRCEPADLIMRDPGKPTIWSLLDGIAEADKPKVLRIIEAFKKTGTDN
jgi:transcriptional regulator with XRE-family HTH domain